MTLIANYYNVAIAVNGFTSTGEDGGGQPTGTVASKGTVMGRIDPKVRPDELNGADLNPVISEYQAITAIPAGFTITERDTMTADGVTYEVVGIGALRARVALHHRELDLRRIAA